MEYTQSVLSSSLFLSRSRFLIPNIFTWEPMLCLLQEPNLNAVSCLCSWLMCCFLVFLCNCSQGFLQVAFLVTYYATERQNVYFQFCNALLSLPKPTIWQFLSRRLAYRKRPATETKLTIKIDSVKWFIVELPARARAQHIKQHRQPFFFDSHVNLQALQHPYSLCGRGRGSESLQARLNLFI